MAKTDQTKSKSWRRSKGETTTAAAAPAATSAAAASPPSSASSSYQARRSTNAAGMNISADGLVWKERLAVVEGVTADGNPQLRIRSYYRNPETQERVWDEAGTGASRVEYATPEMRSQAAAQMKELQFTLDLIPPDNSVTANQPPKSRKGLFGGMFKKKERSTLKDDSKDLNLQRAIARSMADQHNGTSTSSNNNNNNGWTTSDEPRILFDSEISEHQQQQRHQQQQQQQSAAGFQQQEDDDVALAKALSLSAAEQKLKAPPAASQTEASSQQQPFATKVDHMTEEEMLQLAIEQSQAQHASAITAVPGSSNNSTNDTATQPPTSLETPIALNHVSTPPAEKPAVDTFDPYSPNHKPSASSVPGALDASGSSKSSIQKLNEDAENDKVHPGRRMSRKMFGSRRRMEAEAGIL